MSVAGHLLLRLGLNLHSDGAGRHAVGTAADVVQSRDLLFGKRHPRGMGVVWNFSAADVELQADNVSRTQWFTRRVRSP